MSVGAKIILFYLLLSVANWVLLLSRGSFVGAVGVGGAFESGGVAGFGADFAVRRFAGHGAGAVVAGFVEAGRWLGPMLGFFHRPNVRQREEGGRQVFIPWLIRRRAAKLL
jgi:hypothetical protein